MTPKALAILIPIAVAATITPAHAGITAVFGGTRPIVEPAAVRPPPASPLPTPAAAAPADPRAAAAR